MQQTSVWNRWAPPATRNLIVINILLWLASLALLRHGIDLDSLFGLHYFAASDFRLHQLLTYGLLHSRAGLDHVLSNMFALWMFGSSIERLWGSKRFLIYYFVCGISAGLMQELSWLYELGDLAAYSGVATEQGVIPVASYMNQLITIGASGSVFGILLAFGVIFPNVRIYIYFLFPMKAKYFVLLYGLLELFLGVSNTGGSVAHFAHLGGMIGGLILILLWRKKGELPNDCYH